MNDIEIAQQAKIKKISEIAQEFYNLDSDNLELHGHYKAKLPLSLIDENKINKSNLILVTAITPTPAGEGKTTVSIGLAQGLNKIGKNCTAVLREPSLGPVFGIKGGATGGGYSQVIPMEDINLHFTGDFAAIEKANNLLCAMIDNTLHFAHKSTIKLDPKTILFKRSFDMNDRSLRRIMLGVGGKENGTLRESGFNITAASEIMAILCISKDLEDLKNNFGNILVGFDYDGNPVFAKNLNAQGAMAALMRDAIKPNLVQTLDNTPAILHGGPFANIAQGTNSIIATKMGMSLSDYVVTEGGFGADLGAEKFFNIKCRKAGLTPKVVVLVATIRALKYHGGEELEKLKEENVEAVKKGLDNLKKHIENIETFGIKPIVAINKFVTDTDKEIDAVIEFCKSIDTNAITSNVWANGGDGAIELSKQVVEMCEKNTSNSLKLTYQNDWTIKEKIEAIAKTIYGASNVEYSHQAIKDIKTIEKIGLEKLPICIAKTQKSFSDNEKLRNRPTGFTLNVREIEIASGAGFLIPITGTMMRMPGLPLKPAALNIDIDKDGNISGLF